MFYVKYATVTDLKKEKKKALAAKGFEWMKIESEFSN